MNASSRSYIIEDAYKDEERKRSLTTLSVVIGILANLLLFAKSSFWVISFSAFAFRAGLTECQAAPGLDQPIALLEQQAASEPEIQAQIIESVPYQVDVTGQFSLIFRVLFVQSLLFQILACCCCCSGRAQAHQYDRLFIVYAVLLMVSTATYIWAFCLRLKYTSQVCCGDFLDTYIEEDQPILWEEVQDEFYLLGAGKMLKVFVVVETLFSFCCLCSGGIWGFVQPFPLTRVATTVDYTNAEQRRSILADRIAFKLQMREQDAILFQHEEEVKRQRTRKAKARQLREQQQQQQQRSRSSSAERNSRSGVSDSGRQQRPDGDEDDEYTKSDSLIESKRVNQLESNFAINHDHYQMVAPGSSILSTQDAFTPRLETEMSNPEQDDKN